MNLEKAIQSIGNGNFEKGKQMLIDIAQSLETARQKHPGSEWKTIGLQGGIAALQEEVDEMKYAFEKESMDRFKSETMDTINVALRIFGNEYM